MSTGTVPIPDEIPEGTSPYIAEAIRERRRTRALRNQAGITEKEAELRILGMKILLESNPNLEFRNGVPYHPPPTEDDIAARAARRNELRSMRVYRQSIKVRVKRLGLPADQIERMTRQEIIDRDKSICYLCGKTCQHDEIHLDHVIPLSRGGLHTKKNLKVSCSTCNLGKGSMTEAEYRNVLKTRYYPHVRAG